MKKTITLTLLSAVLITSTGWAQQDRKLPPEQAGKIGVPLGQIAFLRDKTVWIMNWDGSNQQKLVTAGNANGRLSWAPDGKRIAFVRQGEFKLQGPDNLGGFHKVYDLFVAYVDSAGVNTNWWRRLTTGLGGRYPEWQPDGNTIVFTNDINAEYVNADRPNYQTCSIDTVGGSYRLFRSDWQDSTDLHAIMPTMGPANLYAFVLFKGFNPAGIVIAPRDVTNFTEKLIREKLKSVPKGYAPAWSPDGKWLAYIHNEMANQAIYITTPDLSEKYLVYKPPIGQNLQTYPLSWAPNSKWLTFGLSDGSLWIIDITGNGLKQIVASGLNVAPAWSKHK
ncbi:MAG: PD40 domain-containing protein [Candidatus Zixiibacteriota bacterium]|nr:MAG: PD40 domain-containing protein [candidate division Zixibacteria bacterium]